MHKQKKAQSSLEKGTVSQIPDFPDNSFRWQNSAPLHLCHFWWLSTRLLTAHVRNRVTAILGSIPQCSPLGDKVRNYISQEYHQQSKLQFRPRSILEEIKIFSFPLQKISPHSSHLCQFSSLSGLFLPSHRLYISHFNCNWGICDFVPILKGFILPKYLIMEYWFSS